MATETPNLVINVHPHYVPPYRFVILLDGSPASPKMMRYWVDVAKMVETLLEQRFSGVDLRQLSNQDIDLCIRGLLLKLAERVEAGPEITREQVEGAKIVVHRL